MSLITLFIIIGIILLLILLLTIINVFVFNYALKRKQLPSEDKLTFPHAPDNSYGLKIDNDWYKTKKEQIVSIKSFDNKTLYGHLLKKENEHHYMIFCHGYRGYYKEATTMLHHFDDSFSFNYLLIEQRAQENSQGKYMTMGIKESRDLKSWVDFILNIDSEAKIYLFGLSMGSSTIMYYLGTDVPQNVKCALCDCGYSSPYEQFKYVLSLGKTNFLVKLCFKTFILNARIFLKVDFKNDTPLKALNKSKCDVLLIHGSTDHFVPYSNLQLCYDALPKSIYKEMLTINGAGHTLCASKNPKEYYSRTIDFIKKYY